MHEAKKRKASADEIYGIGNDQAGEYFHTQDEMKKLTSAYLCSKAARLLVPLPDLQDETMWNRDDPNYGFLNEQGINHVRALIRAEKKARVELLLMWVPGLIGILGALIGLASILVGKK